MPKRRSRSIDREIGHFRLKRCSLHLHGHTVHHIQAIRSFAEPHRDGHLIDVDGNVLTLDFNTEVVRFRNHDPDRLVQIVRVGNPVRVSPAWSILRTPEIRGSSQCFSICGPEEDWLPCRYDRLTSVAPEALAERLQTHGGFLVPGVAVTDREETQ